MNNLRESASRILDMYFANESFAPSPPVDRPGGLVANRPHSDYRTTTVPKPSGPPRDGRASRRVLRDDDDPLFKHNRERIRDLESAARYDKAIKKMDAEGKDTTRLVKTRGEILDRRKKFTPGQSKK